MMFLIATLSAYICASQSAEQGIANSVSCYVCEPEDVTHLPDALWNCTKQRSSHTMTVNCVLSVELCRKVAIGHDQACVASVLVPISFNPESQSFGLARCSGVGVVTHQKKCSLVMSEAEYNNTKVVISCSCSSDLCNDRIAITVDLPTPPPPSLPPNASSMVAANATETAGLSPAEYAAIALGSLQLVLMTSLAALMCALCYRFRQKRRLQRRRLALMKSKFEPTPLHQWLSFFFSSPMSVYHLYFVQCSSF